MSQNYSYPSSSDVTLTGSTNGTPIPDNSIVVGGENASGNVEPLQLDNAGNLKVTLTGSTTEQNVNLTEVGGAPIALGQTTGSASLPVVIASDQSAVPVSQSGTWNVDNITGTISLPTGAATSANQTNGSQIVQISQTTPGTTNGVVVNSSALPTGAATAANQTSVQSATGTSAATAITVQGSASGVAIPVSISGGISNPLPTTDAADGTIGAAVPTKGIQIAGSDGTDLWAISTNSSGQVNINNISGAVSLPTGASTSANQATEIASLATIATNTTGLNNTITTTGSAVPSEALQIGVKNGSDLVALTEGQATSANSIPVVIASDQSAIPVTQSTPAAKTIYQAAVAVGTSAVRLTVSGSAPASNRVVLVATPDASSTGKFYIGSSTVTSSGSTRGIQIVAGQTFIANNDAGDYWIVSDTASQTVESMEQY